MAVNSAEITTEKKCAQEKQTIPEKTNIQLDLDKKNFKSLIALLEKNCQNFESSDMTKQLNDYEYKPGIQVSHPELCAALLHLYNLLNQEKPMIQLKMINTSADLKTFETPYQTFARENPLVFLFCCYNFL